MHRPGKALLSFMLISLLLAGLVAGAFRGSNASQSTQAAAIDGEVPVAGLLAAVETLLEKVLQAVEQRLQDVDSDGTGSLKPIPQGDATDEQDAEHQLTVDAPGCVVDQDSGPGWSRVKVHCHNEEVTMDGRSISVSSSTSTSSSSSTTTSSSSD